MKTWAEAPDPLPPAGLVGHTGRMVVVGGRSPLLMLMWADKAPVGTIFHPWPCSNLGLLPDQVIDQVGGGPLIGNPLVHSSAAPTTPPACFTVLTKQVKGS